MTKQFTRIYPTTIQKFGEKYKNTAVIKRYKTEDGLVHEFTTVCGEDWVAAGVIALTPDFKVISVYQFRPGPEQWVYEIPGGGADPGEDPQDAAIRELKEETGYVPGTIEYLGMAYSDAYSNLQHHYYLALDCVPSKEGAGVAHDQEEHEQGAEVRLITISEIIESAKGGTMSDSCAILLAYEKLKELEGIK